MSSDQSQDNNKGSQIIFETIYEYNEVDARNEEINWLTIKIRRNPNNLRLYQKKAFIISAQANQLEGSKKFKLLIDLSNCYNQIIELFPQIQKQNLNDKNFQQDYLEDDYRIYNGFNEKSLSQIIEDRNQTIDQIQKMVENAKQLINKLDQEILLEPQNYELYLEKAQQQLILAYQKLEQQKFIEEFQKSIQTFQIAILNHPNQQNLLLKKKLEFCQQILKSLDINSLEYLEIVFQIMLVFDEQAQVKPESSQSIQELKFSALWNEFKEYHCNLTSENIRILKQISENCICSIRKLNYQNKRIEIKNLCFEVKVNMIFAKIFTQEYILLINNNIQFQLAQKLCQEIIEILKACQNEFSNELEYLRFKLEIHKELQAWVHRDLEKIQFQEWICQIKEQICQISPCYENLNSLGISKIYKVYEFERLLEFQKKADVRIFNKQILILDKILQLDLNDKQIQNPFSRYDEKPISKAVNHKLKLLIKLNRKLEALEMSRIFLQNEDIYQIEEICYKLLIEQKKFREVQIAGRLTGEMRGLYVCQTMKDKI